MYQALYRKWRPKTFDDVVGQEHITGTLKRQVSSGRLSHAYLFVGTRGTGKTTCAKILSRAINCLQPENGNPCNKCASCLGIENGSILDVLELDAASNNGVDNVRALREEAVFTPVNVKKRVYIIDEVHMLSTPAFNALLKILEEPPEHLVFILATTEIHKVPATILSRCQRFTFKRILPEAAAERLQNIAGQEGISLTDDAAALLARLSDGSLRDALSLLDQCAWEDTVDYDRVLSAIGLAGSGETAGLLRAVANSDAAAALGLLEKLYNSGKVMASVLEELTLLVRDVLITALMPKGGSGLLSGGYDEGVLRGFTKSFKVERLLSILDIIRETSQDLSKSSGGRLSVELCLMRLCDERLTADDGSLLSRISRLEEKIGDGLISVPAAPPQNQNRTAPVAPDKRAAEAPVPSVPEETIYPDACHEDTGGQTEPEITAPVPESVPKLPDGLADRHSDDIWEKILDDIKPNIDIPLYAILRDRAQATAQLEDGMLTIKAKNAFLVNMINVPAVTALLKAAAAAVLKKPVAVRITQEDDSAPGGGSKLDALTDRFPGVVKVE
ncbi:MAG: DNA polymerase III subunit gamma/tau [Clostridiales bacterium]|nr:DNA polymerase III subunit gamma/tau [Clostridiales bacterium]